MKYNIITVVFISVIIFSVMSCKDSGKDVKKYKNDIIGKWELIGQGCNINGECKKIVSDRDFISFKDNGGLEIAVKNDNNKLETISAEYKIDGKNIKYISKSINKKHNLSEDEPYIYVEIIYLKENEMLIESMMNNKFIQIKDIKDKKYNKVRIEKYKKVN